jgi:hypothetical protein
MSKAVQDSAEAIQPYLQEWIRAMCAERPCTIPDDCFFAAIQKRLGSDVLTRIARGLRDTTAVSAAATAPKKKRMSAAARRKISEGQKRRYAELNRAAPKATAPTGGSRLTGAGRKKLSDLMKKRWAERRKGKTK